MTAILIIDDQAPVRGLLRFALERVGYEVIEAANGCEGLALYRRMPMQLVITDIVMPDTPRSSRSQGQEGNMMR